MKVSLSPAEFAKHSTLKMRSPVNKLVFTVSLNTGHEISLLPVCVVDEQGLVNTGSFLFTGRHHSNPEWIPFYGAFRQLPVFNS